MRPAQPKRRMNVPNAWQPRNAARSARDKRSVVAFPSERRRSPRSDRSLGFSPADRRDWLAACNIMHRYPRFARRGACSAGRVSEVGIRRRVRRQPGGQSGRDWCMDVGPPVRAAATQGTRLGGSHHGLGHGGCCKVGEPTEESFGATARDDQHEYDGRSFAGDRPRRLPSVVLGGSVDFAEWYPGCCGAWSSLLEKGATPVGTTDTSAKNNAPSARVAVHHARHDGRYCRT
jgi:hypothetical protein